MQPDKEGKFSLILSEHLGEAVRTGGLTLNLKTFSTGSASYFFPRLYGRVLLRLGDGVSKQGSMTLY